MASSEESKHAAVAADKRSASDTFTALLDAAKAQTSLLPWQAALLAAESVSDTAAAVTSVLQAAAASKLRAGALTTLVCTAGERAAAAPGLRRLKATVAAVLEAVQARKLALAHTVTAIASACLGAAGRKVVWQAALATDGPDHHMPSLWVAYAEALAAEDADAARRQLRRAAEDGRLPASTFRRACVAVETRHGSLDDLLAAQRATVDAAAAAAGAGDRKEAEAGAEERKEAAGKAGKRKKKQKQQKQQEEHKQAPPGVPSLDLHGSDEQATGVELFLTSSGVSLQAGRAAGKSKGKGKGKGKGKLQPNYFVGLRLRSADLLAAAAEVQASLMTLQPQLQEFFTPIQKLHLTLFVLALPADKLAAASKVMAREGRALVDSFFGKSGPRLGFDAVGHFKSDVVFLKPRETMQLARVVDFAQQLHDAFVQAGLAEEGSVDAALHATVLKKSAGPAALWKKLRFRVTDDMLEPLQRDWGVDVVADVQLLAMSETDEDGYYRAVESLDCGAVAAAAASADKKAAKKKKKAAKKEAAAAGDEQPVAAGEGMSKSARRRARKRAAAEAEAAAAAAAEKAAAEVATGEGMSKSARRRRAKREREAAEAEAAAAAEQAAAEVASGEGMSKSARRRRAKREREAAEAEAAAAAAGGKGKGKGKSESKSESKSKSKSSSKSSSKSKPAAASESKSSAAAAPLLFASVQKQPVSTAPSQSKKKKKKQHAEGKSADADASWKVAPTGGAKARKAKQRAEKAARAAEERALREARAAEKARKKNSGVSPIVIGGAVLAAVCVLAFLLQFR
eukprot:PLAT12525.1.p1 GENE.PLAT12525.1~~PLAT12525.1.p1  ORF type:complete len:815 (-),score=428.74 PLAT12525.1:51-2444(-)